MPITKRASALALAVCTCVSAFADPVIDRVEVNGQRATRGPVGGVLVLMGRGFHRCPEVRPGEKQTCRHDELKVKLGAKDCMLLAAGPEQLTVIVPHQGVSPGKTRLRVEVAGQRPAEVPFSVLSYEDWEKSRPPQGDYDPIADAPGDAVGFAITRFELLREQGAVTFVLEGEAKTLPDGFQVDLTLSLDRLGRRPQEIATKRATIASQAFAASFGPYRGEVALGSYQGSALFQLGEQGELRSRKFVSGLSDAERRTWESVHRRTYLTAGTPEEYAVQRAELDGHYTALADACERAGDATDVAVAHRLHAAFRERLVVGLDPEAERCCERMLALALASTTRRVAPGVAAAARAAIGDQRRLLRRALGLKD